MLTIIDWNTQAGHTNDTPVRQKQQSSVLTVPLPTLKLGKTCILKLYIYMYLQFYVGSFYIAWYNGHDFIPLEFINICSNQTTEFKRNSQINEQKKQQNGYLFRKFYIKNSWFKISIASLSNLEFLYEIKLFPIYQS